MTNNTLETLKEFDPAPRLPLAPHQASRRDGLLSAILDSPEEKVGAVVRPTSGHRRRGWTIAGAAALAMGVAAAAVVVSAHPGDFLQRSGDQAAGPLTSVELASWTSTPEPLAISSATGQAAEKWCVGSMNGAPGAGAAVTVTNADIRGSVASMIINRGGYAMLCITGPGGGFWEVDGAPGDPRPTIGDDGISAASTGSHGDGPSGITYVEGLVGKDVRSISITDAGKTFSATVEDGRWAAWWPTPHPHGEITGTLTITTNAGVRHTLNGQSLPGSHGSSPQPPPSGH